ncbi:MAG: O-methyltransferase [Alkalispirochaetaceae bacterium]
MNKYTSMTDTMYEYLLRHTVRDSNVAEEIRAYTARSLDEDMQIAPEQAPVLKMLVRLIGATRALEVGVYTGYSALTVLEAMGDHGTLTACDQSEEWTSIARSFWKKAGVLDRVDLRLGDAMSTLDTLLAEGREGTYDFAFVDADKTGYDGYYERSLRLIRTGGAMVFDNTIWNGQVVDPTAADADTEAIRAFNAKVHADNRIDMVLLPVADGMTVVRKKG